MTWRERIVEARDKGRFTTHDRIMASDFRLCAVGEAAAHFGVEYRAIVALTGNQPPTSWLDLSFTAAVFRNDFERAERTLNEIEDRALELKRAIYG